MAPRKIKARGILPHRRCCIPDQGCLFRQAGRNLSARTWNMLAREFTVRVGARCRILTIVAQVVWKEWLSSYVI